MCLWDGWGVEHSRKSLVCPECAAKPGEARLGGGRVARVEAAEAGGRRGCGILPAVRNSKQAVGFHLVFGLLNFHVKSSRQIEIQSNTIINPSVSATRLKKENVLNKVPAAPLPPPSQRGSRPGTRRVRYSQAGGWRGDSPGCPSRQ